MKNIIESKFTESDKTEILKKIADLEALIEGKIAVLDAAERARYGSINEQNKLVVNKAREFHQNQPALSSPDISWEGFESDYQARMFLENCINRLKAILRDLESTKIMHDYDNLQDALQDYSYSQYKNGSGEPGFAAKVEEFKQFFARAGKTKPPENEESNP